MEDNRKNNTDAAAGQRRDTVNVTRTYMPPIEEYIEEIAPVWESRWITNMGEKHGELKRKLKEYLKVSGLELFVNGHLALEAALQAVLTDNEEIGGEIAAGRNEVITTPYTFASTTHAIVRRGLTPVFCDIRRSDCTMDPDLIESLVTDRTAAILPVHVYGKICDVEAIRDIAQRHGLKVIYDAAHAFGETYRGAGVGTFGDASMFSFHATKVFHTIEGGAVTYSGSTYDDILYKLSDFGIMGPEDVEYVGGNGKMNEFAAAMGLVNLRHVDELIEKRKELTGIYRRELDGTAGLRFLADDPDVRYNYAYMPVIFESGHDRDEVYERLCARNIRPRKYFYPAVNAYKCYRDRYDPMETPVTHETAAGVLTLPLYPDLDPDTVIEISRVIKGEI